MISRAEAFGDMKQVQQLIPTDGICNCDDAATQVHAASFHVRAGLQCFVVSVGLIPINGSQTSDVS